MQRLPRFYRHPAGRVIGVAALVACISGIPVVHSLTNGPTGVQLARAAGAGCQLDPAHGNIKHLVNIIFDNLHFQRDIARDGSTLVPSDLEQMPTLYNFIKNNGVLLSNHHTPLISHTSDDIITTLTGVYPGRHGVATAANSYQFYKPDGTTSFQSGFTYWTDTIGDGAFNLLSAPIDQTHPNGVNAPAPWVPFTRAGCDVGAAGAADMEIENTTTDLTTIFGAGSPQTTDPNAFSNYEGVAIHCAATSTLCSTNNGGFPDKLPSEPNPNGSPATTDPSGTSTAYEGYNALFGHKYVTQAFQNIGAIPANTNLKDINGNDIVDDFPAGTLTPGFPSFSLAPQYSLGYSADMLEAGVPIVYSYIITPHRPLPVNPYGYGHPEDKNDYGPGEAHYVDQLKQYDDAFHKFFTRLANDGITPANTLFVISSDESDHVVAANPTNTGCDGVSTPCTYGTQPGNEVGELNLNFRGLLQAQQGISTPASVTNDDAPDIYLTNNPAAGDPSLRAFEQATGRLTATNPISATAGLPATDTIAQYLVNPTEQQVLHMQTFDPLRTPSFTMFAQPDYFVTGSTACGTSPTPATACVTQVPGFAWNHGDVQPQITTTWLGLVGPGVLNRGIDGPDPAAEARGVRFGTFTDHTDIRPTVLALLGLQDDYRHDGRVITEALANSVLPGLQQRNRQFLSILGQVYKQLNAPVGPLGLDSLKISTKAMESTDANTFALLENQLAGIADERDELAAQLQPVLDWTEPPATQMNNLARASALPLTTVSLFSHGYALSARVHNLAAHL